MPAPWNRNLQLRRVATSGAAQFPVHVGDPSRVVEPAGEANVARAGRAGAAIRTPRADTRPSARDATPVPPGTNEDPELLDIRGFVQQFSFGCSFYAYMDASDVPAPLTVTP